MNKVCISRKKTFQEKFEGLLEAACKERTEDQRQTGYERPQSEAEEEATCLVEEAGDYSAFHNKSQCRFFHLFWQLHHAANFCHSRPSHVHISCLNNLNFF